MRELIEQAAGGNMSAVERLYRQNYGLIWRWALHYAPFCKQNCACDTDDLTQSAFFAVYEAAKTYSPSAGGAWSTWLSWHLQGAMREQINQGGNVRGRVSLDDPIGEDGSTRGDFIADDRPGLEDKAEAREVAEVVRKAVKRLPSPLCDAVTLHKLLECPCNSPEERKLTTAGINAMRRDKALCEAWRAIRAEDVCYHHKGLASFRADWTSATEQAALTRISLRTQPPHCVNA